MTDEDTKEHPASPETPPPAGLVQGELVPPAPVPDEPVPTGPLPGQQPPVAPMTVDPLEPTTTITTAPPTPPGIAPVAPGMSPSPPAYPQPPNQGWAGPPPQGAANFPSQQGEWQQPGYAPGYAPAQGWAAAAPTYGTNILVALAALLLIVFGIAVAVLGAWLLTQGPALEDLIHRMRSVDLIVFKPTRDQLEAAFSASPGALMVLGLLQLLVGVFVFAHRGWARWLGVLLGVLGLLLSIVALTSALALVPGTSVQLMIAIALLIGYAFVVLTLLAGGGHFLKRYPGR